jgi:uncharacterized protein (TIGR00106 family)
MLFSVSMFPIGSGDSLSHPVADVIDEIDRAGLPYQVSAMDTVVEGRWEDVMPVIRRAHERMIAAHPRVYLSITVDEHRGSSARLEGAIADVDRELGRIVAR